MNNLEKFKANNSKKPTNSANQMRSRRKQDFSSMHYWWLFTTLRRKIQKLTKKLYPVSHKTIFKMQRKSDQELIFYATISEGWGDFLVYVGRGSYGDWELDRIWLKYGKDNSEANGD